MVKRLTNIALLTLCALTLSAQQMYMQVEVLQPAEVTVPSNVRTLLLMDNTTLSTDEPRRCLFAAAETLTETDRYDEVSVGPVIVPGTLQAAQIDSLIERYEVDAVLALNALVISEYDARAYWTIHYSSQNAFSFFTGTELDINEAEPAAFVGEQMAFIIAPYWQTEDRYFYRNDDPQLLAGIEAVRHKDWNAAIKHWQMVDARSTLSSAYAAANIAVALEMQDRFDEAVAQTEQAIRLFGKIHTSDAAQQLVNLRFYQSQLNLRAR